MESMAPRGRYHPVMVTGMVRMAETLMILLILWRWGGGLPSLGLAPSSIIPGLTKGLIGSAAFGVLVMIGFAALMAAGINPLSWIHADLPSAWADLLIFFIVGGLIGPIAEEVLFRGVLYGFFRRWGVIAAVTLSTLLFVLAHPTGFSVPWLQIAGGVLFAAAYEMTGSLVTPMTIHVLGNLAIFSLPLLSPWVL